jgi:DNA-binding response OmpR family regulator
MDARRILVVDDDAEARELLADFLSQLGHTIETAHDGVDALSRLEVFPAELVVTDLEMPGMSGLELIAVLRERASSCPTLLVTARADRMLPRSVLGGGLPASACLLKPLDLDDLAAVVERLTDGTHECGLEASATQHGP